MKRHQIYFLIWLGLSLVVSLDAAFQFHAANIKNFAENSHLQSENLFYIWLDSLHQWDVRWYYSIAEDGYGHLPQSYAFPPLFAWILKALSIALRWLTLNNLDGLRSFQVAALTLSLSSFYFMNQFLMDRILKFSDLNRDQVFLMLLCNPVAYFGLTGYSDCFYSAFMLLTLTSLERVRIENESLSLTKKIYAGLLAFCVPWVRLTGITVSVLALRKSYWALLALLGFAAWTGLEYLKTGHPLFFLAAQSAFGMPPGGFLDGLSDACNTVFSFFQLHNEFINSFRLQTPLWGQILFKAFLFGFVPLVTLAIGCSAVVFLFRRRDFDFALILTASLVLSHNQAFWRSTTRYSILAFPIFLIAASRFKPKIALGLATVFLLFQYYFLHEFCLGNWAF